ncbi:MAG: hypothetical protein H6686_04735 [Fibrobacteria bacterium]|nr:hypothetical protein [Fibrobacteria bacterium]
MKRFLQILRDLDGKPYGHLRKLSGTHDTRDFILGVDHVQGDPHGPPSRLHVRLRPSFHPVLARWSTADELSRLAAEDLYLRLFAARLPKESITAGDGPGGRFRTSIPGPEIRKRSGCRIDSQGLMFRFTYAIPAEGRRVLSSGIADALVDRLPAVLLDILAAVTESDIEKLAAHLQERRVLRESMDRAGLVAFLPEGAIAARDKTGRPVAGASPLHIPESLARELETSSGVVRGLAIPRGLTVLVGAAFHGKTTLLESLRHCSFDLGPQDGLARAVAVEGTEFIAVEEDRAVSRCDLSAFFRELPGDVDTRRFQVAEASGSTSQAANLHESLTTGAPLLLIDEDASAANFLTRDPRIASLLPGGESVVPLTSRVRELVDRGHSFVVVAGASAEWLAVADRVIALHHFQPRDVTEKAHEVARSEGLEAPRAAPATWDEILSDQIMDGWNDVAQVPPARVRVADGLVKLGGFAEARLPRRFADDDRLRAAAVLLCSWMRHCRDRALTPTRTGLLEFQRGAHDGRAWGIDSGHDLTCPTLRETWGIWTRLVPGRGGPTAS